MTSSTVSGTSSYQSGITYDANGNRLLEQFTDGRANTQYQYGLDNQLIYNLSGTKYEQIQNSSGQYVQCGSTTQKWNTYELGGRLVKTRSKVDDTSNIDLPYNVDFTDYFYYNHEGVIAERHDDIGGMKYFTRLGGELLTCNSGGSNYFYIQNIRGDVLMLVDEVSGYVKSIRDYDSSGGMLSRTPRDGRDPFGFTGGIDAGNGLWKLGARFYDSSKGSFIQQDRYMGDPSDPLSLNRYVYCNLDPVNFVDPTGFMGHAVANFGRQVMNGAPHPYLRAAGMAIVGIGMGIILVESISAIIHDSWDSVNDNDVIVTDPFGNSIPVRNGERVEGSPDGKTWQKKDKNGNPTGDRYDGKGHPKQKDPKAQQPHGHRVGPDGNPITDPDGNPHLPANS